MRTIKEVLIAKYHTRCKDTQELHADEHLLFDVIIEYIKQNKWKYDGKAAAKPNFIDMEHNEQGYNVNCFNLADLMVDLSIEIGINHQQCIRHKIRNFANNKDEYVDRPYQSFDQQNLKSINGIYAFDVHCVAKINNYYFDITLQTKYPSIKAGVIDVLERLFNAIEHEDFIQFHSWIHCLTDINAGDHENWTLLHHACALNKYDFVEFLLKNNANAYKRDILPQSLAPIDILHISAEDRGLRLWQKQKINDCLKLQADMIFKNQVAITMQTLWRGYKVRNNIWKQNQAANHIQALWRKHNNKHKFRP